jgi:hypothetical protein
VTKKVVGVFVRFSCAASGMYCAFKIETICRTRLRNADPDETIVQCGVGHSYPSNRQCNCLQLDDVGCRRGSVQFGVRHPADAMAKLYTLKEVFVSAARVRNPAVQRPKNNKDFPVHAA